MGSESGGRTCLVPFCIVVAFTRSVQYQYQAFAYTVHFQSPLYPFTPSTPTLEPPIPLQRLHSLLATQLPLLAAQIRNVQLCALCDVTPSSELPHPPLPDLFDVRPAAMVKVAGSRPTPVAKELTPVVLERADAE